jgi:4-hydroxybenzoate polyprenyltransferase
MARRRAREQHHQAQAGDRDRAEAGVSVEKRFRIFPLLQLLRLPNLFTVPGDPLCGALLASHGVWSWKVLMPAVVSMAAYCSGLVINDLADFSEDLRERPGRPLPSGSVSRGLAIALALSFSIVALAAAALVNKAMLILAAMLLVEILWYNLLAKKNALIAPIAMGICRGLSVLVGAAAIAPPPTVAIAAAGVITLYIAGVTALARKETGDARIPPLIGALIRGLLFAQAGFCIMAGGAGWAAALVLLALWPVSRLVGSRFYAS